MSEFDFDNFYDNLDTLDDGMDQAVNSKTDFNLLSLNQRR